MLQSNPLTCLFVFQFSAPSENDRVRHLRNASDAAAISTMRNHWESYVTPSMIHELASRGIDRVRVPVGYWISEAPVRHPPCPHSAAPGQLCEALITNWAGCRCKWQPDETGVDTCGWECADGQTMAARPATMYVALNDYVFTRCYSAPEAVCLGRYDFGFNNEGFATGGINYLERLLSSMQQHGIQAIIDLHAVPSGGTDWDACKSALAGTLTRTC